MNEFRMSWTSDSYLCTIGLPLCYLPKCRRLKEATRATRSTLCFVFSLEVLCLLCELKQQDTSWFQRLINRIELTMLYLLHVVWNVLYSHACFMLPCINVSVASQLMFQGDVIQRMPCKLCLSGCTKEMFVLVYNKNGSCPRTFSVSQRVSQYCQSLSVLFFFCLFWF